MKIDAHQHFWQFDPIRDAWIDEKKMAAIRQDFMPNDLDVLLKKNDFDGCIAVQADQSETETLFLLNLAEEHDFIKGVVGWIDLKAKDVEKRLEYFTQFPKLKGFRHILQGEKAAFMLDDQFINGVRLLQKYNFTYDILVFSKQLSSVKIFLQKTENQLFVIDHLAKPSIKNKAIKQWKKHIRTVAQYENVFCKLSGMVTEANWKKWKSQDFEPYLDIVLEAFGTDRLMYGSDWPVCLLAAEYEEQFAIIQQYISTLSSSEQSKILGENALNFYKI